MKRGEFQRNEKQETRYSEIYGGFPRRIAVFGIEHQYGRGVYFIIYQGAALEKNPDRAISPKLRTVSNLWVANLPMRKIEVLRATTPTAAHPCAQIVQRRYRGVDISTTHRDIARSCKLIPAHHRVVAILRRSFSAAPDRKSSDVIGGYLPLPFGWAASPGFPHLVTQEKQDIHASRGQMYEDRGAQTPYMSSIFADGAIFLEPRRGRRPGDSVSPREWARAGVLSETSIREDRAWIEGQPDMKHALFGFEIDTKRG